mmetsp:Transcript_86465/g.245173  ORF Transcript_86465/g.245173 Transcript_86465/m.245173 type:complete len:242 (+) Transcript_86465:580-1305(+)
MAVIRHQPGLTRGVMNACVEIVDSTSSTPNTAALPKSITSSAVDLYFGCPWTGGIAPVITERTTIDTTRPRHKLAESCSFSKISAFHSLVAGLFWSKSRARALSVRTKMSKITHPASTMPKSPPTGLSTKKGYSRTFPKTSIAAKPQTWPPSTPTASRAWCRWRRRPSRTFQSRYRPAARTTQSTKDFGSSGPWWPLSSPKKLMEMSLVDRNTSTPRKMDTISFRITQVACLTSSSGEFTK